MPCPRCGEAVPAARWPVDGAIQAGLPSVKSAGIREGAPPGDKATAAKPDHASANRRTALVILGIMCAMGSIGLSYALCTTDIRQARHPWMPKKLEPIAFRRPLDLPGLRYLPKDCKLVAGLHVAEMVGDEKAGKKLLAEPRPAILDWSLKQIARTTGMTPEEIDHVVLGAADFSQLVLVVKARGKVSLEKIAEAKPIRSEVYQNKPLYEFSLKPAGEALLWCVDDQTIVSILRLDAPKVEQLQSIAPSGRPIAEVLPAPLHEAVKERLPKHNFAWAAGRIDQLGTMRLLLPMLGGQADFGALNETKTFAVSLAPVDGLTLTGHFNAIDAKAAAKLQARLEDVKLEGATSKVEATPSEAPEQWVSWQLRSDAATMRSWLGAKEPNR
jgi:hypothetical protein